MALRVRHGTSFHIIAEALDWSGIISTDCTGTVHFSVSVRGETLPANHTFTATEAGYLAFEGVIL
jgi:hypothetical protein